MQIALTKKLAEAMNLKPLPDNCENPLFAWTANWAKVWDNRHAEDMLVLINNATRFTVAVYQVKRKDMQKVGAEMMLAAIRNTLLALNLNAEIVDEYLEIAGGAYFTANKDRKMTAWVNRAGLECAFYAGRKYEHTPKVFDDAVAAPANLSSVGGSVNPDDGFKPCDAMFAALAELTGKPIYKYRAFELLVTLDLAIYKATRRLIVPANITFSALHDVLQEVFHWKNSHMHEFNVFDDKNKPIITLVTDKESLEYAENGVLEESQALLEYFPQYKRVLYIYDMGDNWEHQIELVRAIEEHDADSPYLLEAVGQTPPENVGGVGGFIDFCEIILDPEHEDYEFIKDWAGYWKPELAEYETRPGVVRRWR
ncbi:hypothetical protein FACS18945_5460 [Bacteroidia bacterium]|nr:hypothetical protein FACS18945_5460 [Bacteroidia bacterium]